MVQLTISKGTEDKRFDRLAGETVVARVATLEEAISLGQSTGMYYEVLDLSSGRIIDWNEVNLREDDENWFYDDAEMIWKKYEREEKVMEQANQFNHWEYTFPNNEAFRRIAV